MYRNAGDIISLSWSASRPCRFTTRLRLRVFLGICCLLGIRLRVASCGLRRFIALSLLPLLTSIIWLVAVVAVVDW